MTRTFLLSMALLCVALTARGWATEPMVGNWQLEHQELNGLKKETEPLTLRISTDHEKFVFAFAVPVNNIDFVSLTYTAKLDGTEADVKNARGDKVGTVQITTPSKAHYRLLLKGTNRPETVVTLVVSADGNTLTSESSSAQAGQSSHLVQSFSRH